MDLSSRVPMMDLDEAMEVYKDLSLASDLDLKDAFTVFSEHLLQGRNWDFLEKKLKNDLLQRLTFCLLNVTDELILLFLKEKFQKIFKKMVAEEINNKDLKIIQEEKQLVINILEDTFKKYCRWGNANSEEGWEECFYHIDKQDLLSYFLKLKDMLGNDLLPTLEDSIFKLMDALKLAGDEFIFEFYKDRLLKEKEAISLCYGHRYK